MANDEHDLTSALLLGIDGGGTRCRARLARRPGGAIDGVVLAEAEAGPANLRLGQSEAFAAVLTAARRCLADAGLPEVALGRIDACLALAGASEPVELAAAQRRKLPFHRTLVTTDAEAACVGAHGGADGAIIVIGTGSIGWSFAAGKRHRVGGWGLPVSDEGSGAWLGLEVSRRTLWAHDGMIGWTPLLAQIFADFDRDPHAIVRWAATARPADYGRLAPLVVGAARDGDPVAGELMRLAAAHIDALAARLAAVGAERIALVGGLAPELAPHLAAATQALLVPAQGDALGGALQLAAALPEREVAA